MSRRVLWPLLAFLALYVGCVAPSATIDAGHGTPAGSVSVAAPSPSVSAPAPVAPVVAHAAQAPVAPKHLYGASYPSIPIPVDQAEGDVLAYHSGAWDGLAPTTSGYVLTSNGPGALPSYQAAGGGGSGITQLTGRGTAGPGSGSQAFALANSGITAGTYGSASLIPVCTFSADGTASSCTTTPSASLSQPGTTLVFQPGGTASPGVFTSWPALYAAAGSVTGPLRIFFDGTFSSNALTIPSGTYAFAQPEILFDGSLQSIGGGNTPQITIANGATISGQIDYHNVAVNSASTSPVFTITGTTLIDLNGSQIDSTTSAPLYTVSSGGELLIYGYNGATLGNVSGTTHAVASVTGSGRVNVGLRGNGSVVFPNALGGVLSGTNLAVGIFGEGSSVEQTGIFVYYSGVNPSSIVFKPGAVTQSYNQFSDWTEVVSAAASTTGPVTIVFDGSLVSNAITIPAGTWAFPNQTTFAGATQNTSLAPANVVHVTAANGATLAGVSIFDQIIMDTVSSSPVFTVTSGKLDWKGNYQSQFVASGSAPLISVSGTGLAVINLYAGSSTINNGSPVISSTAVGGGGSSINLDDIATAGPNSIVRVSGDLVSVNLHNPSASDQDAITANNYSSTKLVFQPGGSVLGNIYTDWPTLYQVAIGYRGPIEVDFDCSHSSGTCTIPAGAWNFTNSRVKFQGSWPALGSTFATVNFANGATLSGVSEWELMSITSASSAPVISVSTGSYTFFMTNVAISPSTGIPFLNVSGSALVQGVFYNGCVIGTSSFVAMTTTGASASLQLSLYERGIVNSSASVTGTGIQYFVYSNSAAIPAGSAGTVTLETAAALDGYNDTLASPTLGATQVQAAIDILKARFSSAGLALPANGGTGVASPTAHAVLVAEGSSPATPITMGDAKVLFGQTGADPAAKTISGDLACVDTGVCTVDGLGGVSVPTPPGTGTTVLTDTTGTLSWSAAGGSGITQLTGRVTAGPGSGSQVASLSASGVTAATYGSSSTVPVCAVSADGTISSCTNTTIAAPLGSGTGITLPVNGGTGVASPAAHDLLISEGASAMTPVSLGAGQILVGQTSADPAAETVSGDATLSSAGALTLATTGVTASTYGSSSTVGEFTVDAKGRITAASAPTISISNANLASGAYANITGVGALASGSLTTGFTAINVAQGGSGVATHTAHGAIVGEGTSAVATTAAGTAGQLFLGQGATSDPAFETSSQDVVYSAAGVATVNEINAASALDINQAAFTWRSGAGAPTFSQATPTSDVATTGFIWNSQAPFASATTNKSPGSFTWNVPAPVSGGTSGRFFFDGSGSEFLRIGQFGAAESPPHAGIGYISTFLTLIADGGIIDHGQNLYIDGSTFWRSAAGTGGQATMTTSGLQIGDNGSTAFDGGVSVIGLFGATTIPTSAAASGHAVIYANSNALETNGAAIQFNKFVTAPIFTQATAAASTAGATMVLRGQTGGSGNMPGGNVFLEAGLPNGSGASSSISMESSAFESTVSATPAGALMSVSNGDGIAVQPGHVFADVGPITESLVHTGQSGFTTQQKQFDSFSNGGVIGMTGALVTATSQVALASGHSVVLVCHGTSYVTTGAGSMVAGDTAEMTTESLIKDVGGTVSRVGLPTTVSNIFDTDYDSTSTVVAWNNAGTTIGCFMAPVQTGGGAPQATVTVWGEAYFN